MRRHQEQITLLPQVGEEGERQAPQAESISGPSGWHSPGRSTLHAERSTTPGPFSSRVALLLVLVFAIGSAITHGATYVGGPITVDTTWTTAGSPYIVESDVTVGAESGPAPVLSIFAGVTVKFNAGTGLYIGSDTSAGKLYAVATSASRVTFTSNGSTQRGYWNGIVFTDLAENTSAIQYANVLYGGGANPGAITIDACNVSVKNTTIKYSSAAGIHLQNGGAPTMASNAVSYTTGYVLSFDSTCRISAITSVTGSSTNTLNLIEARGGLITGSNETWRKLSIPYHVRATVSVWGSPTTTTKLTLAAGLTAKMAAGAGIQIGDWDNPSNKAALYAVGTATKVTKLTSDQATVAPAQWRGIQLLDGASDTASSIQYLTLEAAGEETNAGIWLYSCKPTIKNSVTVKVCQGSGILMEDSASTVTGVTLSGNTGYGLKIQGDSARAANLSSLTFSGNGQPGVEYARGEIRESSETLPYLGSTGSYDLPNGVYVHGANSVAAKLTLGAGVRLRCLNGSSLSIGNDLAEEPAILVASGTATLPIVIEGADPSPGSFGAVWLNSSVVDASTILEFVTARYATTGFYLTNCSPTIRSSIASSCSGSGFVLGGACAPVITGGATENNGGYGLEVDAPSLMSGITGLSFAGNGQPIRYVGRQLTGSGDSLPNLGAAYQVEGSLVVRGNPGESPLLRLAAGVEMRFPEHERLVVGGGASDPAGALDAIGTQSQPILLHSQTGVWAGALVDSSSLDSSTHLSYVIVAEGGQDDAALYIAGSSPVIDNLTISGSQQFGLILWEAAPTITTATITGTASAPILASANCRLKNLSGFTFDADTFISHSGGRITGEAETFPAFSIPIRMAGSLEVYGDLTTAASLTLSAGSRLEFPAATVLNVGTWADASQGILISAGTETSPVVLTGVDGAGWQGISFLDGSVDGSTRLDFTTIALGGAGSNRAVYVGKCSPLLYNCSITRSSAVGLWAEASPSLQVTNSTFDSNASYAASIDIMTSLAAFNGNIFVNNDPDLIQQRGGDVTADTRIAYAEHAYVLESGIAIHGSTEAAATLAIDPGVELRMNSTGGITVGLPTGEKGRLVAEGTVSLPIRFTTNLTPAPAAWHGLELYTSSPASVLTHCVIEYAGNGNEKSVELIGGAAAFASSTIREGQGDGLVLRSAGASATLTDCTIDGFTRNGVDLQDTVAFSMTDGTIQNCGTYGLQLAAVSPTLNGVTITSCASAPVRATTSSRLKNIGTLTIDPSATVSYVGGRLQGEDEVLPGLTYQLTTGLEIANDTMTPTTLTLLPAATLRFPSAQKLIVGGTSGQLGALVTQGTATQPVTLTGYTQSRGSWGGLELRDSTFDATTRIAYTTVQYASSPGVMINSCSPVFEDSRITQSLGAAISASGSSASFLRCTVDANGGDGLSASSGGSIVLDSTAFSSNTWGINSSTGLAITGCTVSSNTSGGIKLTGGSSTVSGGTVASSPTGIYLDAATAALTNLTISGCTGYPLSISALSSLTGSSGLTLSANGKEAIEHRAGTITDTQTLPALGVPYDVAADLSVIGPRGGAAALLTLDPATTLRFASGKALKVADGGYSDQHGALRSLGTAGSPVTLRSQTAGQAGSWAGVNVTSYADPAQLSLSYLTVLDATTGLTLRTGPTTITGLTAENCSNYGLILGDAYCTESQRVTVTGSSIARNTGGGIYIAGHADLLDSMLTENTGSAVLQDSTNASSMIEGCTISANGANGLYLVHGTNTTRECAITSNAGMGVRLGDDSQLTASVQNCTISGNQQGGATLTGAYNQDIRENYWGDSTGPAGLGRGSGDSVGSAYFIYEPWLESPYSESFSISEGWASNRVAPSRQSEVYFWASAPASAAWTFEIRSEDNGLQHSSEWNGNQFLHRWDCLDQQGLPLAAGYYNWRLTAARSENPSEVAPVFAGTIEIKAGAPVVEVRAPIEQSDLTGMFDIVGTVGDSPTSWTLYGGPGESWLPQRSSWVQLATGTTAQTLSILATQDLSSKPDGRYVYALTGTNANGTVQQYVTVNRRGLTVAPNPFSPNGDGVEDSATFSGTFDATSWDLAVRDSTGATVRYWSGSGGIVQVEWDGKDEGAQVVEDGEYAYTLSTHGGVNPDEQIDGFLAVRKTAAAAILLAPEEGLVISSVLSNLSVPVRGTIQVLDGATYRWKVEYGAGTAPSSWTQLAVGESQTPLTDYLFTTWQVDPIAIQNDWYTLRLSVEVVGGSQTWDERTIRVGNFHVDIMNASRMFNPGMGETGTIRIDVGLDSAVTLEIYRVADTWTHEEPVLVRRLMDRQAFGFGTYDISWDGKDDAAAWLPDHAYTVKMSAYQGDSLICSVGETGRDLWEETMECVSRPDVDPEGTYDPFRQPPYRFTYWAMINCLLGSRVVTADYQVGVPGYEEMYLFTREFHTSGTHLLTWDGLMNDRVLAEMMKLDFVTLLRWDREPARYSNLIGLYGMTPKIESISVDAPTYRPGEFAETPAGAILSYSLDRSADVTIELVQLATGTVVQTWSLPGEPAGALELAWGGTLEDGRSLDPGDYRWRVKARANGIDARPASAVMAVKY